MRIKKMLAVLAAISMLVSMGISAAAEDETAATTTVTTAEEAVTTAATEATVTMEGIIEIEETTTLATEIAMSGDSSNVTSATVETTVIEADEVISSITETTTTATEANETNNLTTTETTESTVVTTETTYSEEEAAEIMQYLWDQMEDLAGDVILEPGVDPFTMSKNFIQLEDGTFIGLLHTYFTDEDGDTWQVVYCVSQDGTSDVFYTTLYDEHNIHGNWVIEDNAFFDEFFVSFSEFYSTLENTSDYYVMYCGTDNGVNPTMYVAVEMKNGDVVFYAVSQNGIEEVEMPSPPVDPILPEDPVVPAVAIQKTDSTPKTGDVATLPAVALGLTMTAAGVAAIIYKKRK